MSVVAVVCQVALALVVANVWLFRQDRPTPFRPEGASNMNEEFARYGLPPWAVVVVGGMKLTLAAFLVLGTIYESVAAPAALLMGALMTGAVAMHLRVRDPLPKALPAALMLVLSAVVVVGRVL